MTRRRINLKHSRPRVIAVDVDKTLFNRGECNEKLVTWLKAMAQDNYEILVWSGRGTKYANAAVERAGLSGIVHAVISKPGYIVDDVGWEWIKYTKVVPIPRQEPATAADKGAQ